MSDRLTAMDVESQEFKAAMRGYDRVEVRMYLESVASELQGLRLANAQQLEEVGRLKTEVDELRGRERMLQETLVSAQRMTEEMKARARAEGELLIQQARLNADQLLKGAEDELIRLESVIRRSKVERDTLDKRLHAVIDEHLRLLELRADRDDDLDNLRVLPRRANADAG
jgi:cell division initiation protein